MDQNEYEAERLRNMEANRARMAELVPGSLLKDVVSPAISHMPGGSGSAAKRKPNSAYLHIFVSRTLVAMYEPYARQIGRHRFNSKII